MKVRVIRVTLFLESVFYKNLLQMSLPATGILAENNLGFVTSGEMAEWLKALVC